MPPKKVVDSNASLLEKKKQLEKDFEEHCAEIIQSMSSLEEENLAKVQSALQENYEVHMRVRKRMSNVITTLEEATKRTKQQVVGIYERVEKKLAEELETSQDSSDDAEGSEKEQGMSELVKSSKSIVPAIRTSASKPRKSGARVHFEDDVANADVRKESEDAPKNN